MFTKTNYTQINLHLSNIMTSTLHHLCVIYDIELEMSCNLSKAAFLQTFRKLSCVHSQLLLLRGKLTYFDQCILLMEQNWLQICDAHRIFETYCNVIIDRGNSSRLPNAVVDMIKDLKCEITL